MNNTVIFQCPQCRVELKSAGALLQCPACAATTPLNHGIPGFTDNRDYFFGEISSEAMLELAAAIDRDGWDAAFAAMCEQQTKGLREYIRQYIADASRANWKYLLQLPEDAVVLDFGCGWGETTLSLARSVRRVVSMDLTLERLILLQARARHLGLSHVDFAHGGDRLPLPFPDGSFDVVVLNGVLEWVPVTGEGNPRDCQLAVLRELRRVLKPGGQLYIGIENRAGLKYFRGSIDEHSKLKFTTLLPRWLASCWSRIRKQQDYRTWTYTRRGYHRLLQEAGFAQADFYCPYPDYREFEQIVPVSTDHVRQLFRPAAAWKRLALQLPGSAGLLAATVPSFSIVASVSEPGPSRLSRVVEKVSSRTGVALDQPAAYHSRPVGEVFACCRTSDGTGNAVLLRVAETPTAVNMRLASAEYLESLWQRNAGAGPCMAAVPRSLGHGFLENVAFTVEELKDGDSWRRIPDFVETPGEALLTAAAWLTEFQQSTGTGERWEHDELSARSVAFVEQLRQLFADMQPVSHANDGAADPHFNFAGVPVVVCHGDFHLDNLLFSPNDRGLTGVVDWDLGEIRGLPLSDIIYLLLYYGMEVKQQTYSRTVQSIMQPHRLTAAEHKVLHDCESAFGLDAAWRKFAVRMTVLQNIVTLAARRPEAFQRLKPDLNELSAWWTTATACPSLHKSLVLD